MPASVYIPFVQNATRNNCVLHILSEEARIFQTKERAPIMLSIEVFRPDEMAMELKKKVLKKREKEELLKKQPDNPYFTLRDSDHDSESMNDGRSSKKGFAKIFEMKSRKRRESQKQKRSTTLHEVNFKINKNYDKDASKTLMIKKVKNKKDILKKMNDDFGVNLTNHPDRPSKKKRFNTFLAETPLDL